MILYSIDPFCFCDTCYPQFQATAYTTCTQCTGMVVEILTSSFDFALGPKLDMLNESNFGNNTREWIYRNKALLHFVKHAKMIMNSTTCLKTKNCTALICEKKKNHAYQIKIKEVWQHFPLYMNKTNLKFMDCSWYALKYSPKALHEIQHTDISHSFQLSPSSWSFFLFWSERL